MARMNIPGSIYRRDNGRYQAVGPEVYDPEKGKRRRLAVHVTGKSTPISQVEQHIGKSLAYADVWNVFQTWRAG